jgi:hypothetical protein
VVEETLDDGCNPPKRVGPDVQIGTLIERTWLLRMSGQSTRYAAKVRVLDFEN